MLPDLDDTTTRAAAWLTSIGGVLAGLWKIRGWLKNDSRVEGAADRSDDGWRRIVDGLEAHVKRLEGRAKAAEDRADVTDKRHGETAKRLRDEIDARYLAETRAHQLENQIAGLRAQLAERDGMP